MAGAKTRIHIHSNVATIKRGLEGEIAQRLRKVGEVVASAVRRRLREHSTRSEGPSKPHEIPHADQGDLSKGVSYSFNRDRLETHVGVVVAHGKFLTEGTANMAERPFLEPVAREMAPQVKRIMTAPIKLGSRGAGAIADIAGAITEGEGE